MKVFIIIFKESQLHRGCFQKHFTEQRATVNKKCHCKSMIQYLAASVVTIHKADNDQPSTDSSFFGNRMLTIHLQVRIQVRRTDQRVLARPGESAR